MKRVIVLIVMLFWCPSILTADEIFVAPKGKADNTGTVTSPLSWEAGLVKLSGILETQGVPAEGLTLSLRGGNYHFTEPFVLDERFTGSTECPIVIRAYGDETVTFDGSARISPDGFLRITDQAERQRLASSAVDKIRVRTITDPVLIARFKEKLILTLSYNGKVYLPSIYPNQGYAILDSNAVVPEVCPPGIIPGQEDYGIRAGSPPHQEPGKPQFWLGTLDEPRGAQAGIAKREHEMAGTWQQWENELKRNNKRNLLTGYIDANWLLRSQALYAANGKSRCMHLSSALRYGWFWRNKDKTFKVFGLLCELDQPGEWHFDTLTNRLYIYPPEPLTSDTQIGMPLANGFIQLNNTAYVSIIGLNVQNIGSDSVYDIKGGHHNLIAGCTIRNSTACGIKISGKHNGAKGCDFIDLDDHVLLNGGVRGPHEISSGHNTIENCHIYQNGFRHQRINVFINGVGNIFRNNLVHNSLGQPIDITGNDHLIELNEVFNVGYDEGDGGAIYSGADLAGYGNVYRHNFIHHLMHVPGKVTRAGIYLDDMQAGGTCIGNIFYKSESKGIYMNGGAGHTIIDNVFLEGHLGPYNTESHGQKTYDWYLAIQNDPNHMYQNTKENYIGRTERQIGTKAWTKAPWKDRYPLFHQVMTDTGQFGRLWPIRCRFEGNLYYGNNRENNTHLNFGPEVRAKTILKGDRLVTPDDFENYDNLDLRFKSVKQDLPQIPFAKIGLYLDTYRRAMPQKTHYRKVIKQFFNGIPSMPGTHKQIDTSEVVETGPIEIVKRR